MYYFKNRTLAVTNANKLKYVKMLSWIIMPPSTSEPPDQLTSTPAASWGPREPCVLTQSRWHFLPKMSVVVGTTMKMLCKHVVMEMKLLNSNQWPTCFIRAVSHSIHGHSLSLSLWDWWGRPKIWPLMMQTWTSVCNNPLTVVEHNFFKLICYVGMRLVNKIQTQISHLVKFSEAAFTV